MDGFSLEEAATAVGASKRTLARRLQAVLGRSPLSFFQSLRIERAVHLLKTGDASVEEVASQVGYADGTTLRALLRRRLHLGIKEIKRASWSPREFMAAALQGMAAALRSMAAAKYSFPEVSVRPNGAVEGVEWTLSCGELY